jgi:hypothetical protein
VEVKGWALINTKKKGYGTFLNPTLPVWLDEEGKKQYSAHFDYP